MISDGQAKLPASKEISLLPDFSRRPIIAKRPGTAPKAHLSHDPNPPGPLLSEGLNPRSPGFFVASYRLLDLGLERSTTAF